MSGRGRLSRRRFMAAATATVDALLAQLPADDPARARVQAQTAKYNRECGCALSSFSLTATLLLVAGYFAVTGDLSVRSAAAGVALVLAAAAVGKAVGLLVASLRLALLRRSLSKRLRVHGRGHHVYVH